MARKPPSGRYVVRSASAVIAFWIGMVVLLVVVGSPIAQADWSLLWFVLAPSLLLAWVLWIALYRPAVHYDADRAVVVNLGRRHILPWSHVTGVRQGIGLIFDLDAGKSVIAAGVPARRQPGNIMSGLDRRTRPTHDFHQDAEILDGVRRAAATATEAVTARWDVVPLLIGAVLVLAVAAEFLIRS